MTRPMTEQQWAAIQDQERAYWAEQDALDDAIEADLQAKWDGECRTSRTIAHHHEENSL